MNLATACLTWIDRAITAIVEDIEFDLETGIWYWADLLLPQYQQLMSNRQPGQAALHLRRYCEICLEVCDGILQEEFFEDPTLDLWRDQLAQASRAFSQAEALLDSNRLESSLWS